MEAYTLLASFLLGLLYGRSSAAKAEPVDPQIAFVPPAEAGHSWNFVEDLTSELSKRGIPPEQAREAACSLLSSPEIQRILKLLERGDRALRILKKASTALENGSIPPHVYRHLARKYMKILAEVRLELEKVDPASLEKTLALALPGKQ